MRLIDADRLLLDKRMLGKYYHLPNGDVAIPIIDIEHAPTVEVETERTGKWIIQDGTVVCSQCFEPNKETNYCPHCGARMVEE